MFIDILKLIRVKDWSKNLLIFLPLIFSNNLLSYNYYFELLIAFIIFSLLSSVIYILNDIQDIDYDSKNLEKINQKPIANNKISIPFAKFIILFLFLLLSTLVLFYNNLLIFISTYFLLNIFYIYILKNLPLLDIICVSIGYLIRIEVGSSIISVERSILMLLSIFFISIFVLSIKRRKEIENNKYERFGLRFYNLKFLKILSYISFLSSLGFFINYIIYKNTLLFISIPIVTYVFLRYLYISNNTKKGEMPIDLVIRDTRLLFSCVFFFIIVFYSFL